jgi:hypothetical protein
LVLGVPTVSVTFAVRFPSVKARQPLPYAEDWSALRLRLLQHEERSDKYKGDLYSPVTYAEGTTRGNANVRLVHALVIDLDGEALETALPKLADLEWVAYTTYSHSDNDPHWHLVLPLASPVPADEWELVWAHAHDRLGLVGDPACKDPARIFFLPQHAPGSVWRTLYGEGHLLKPIRGIARPRKNSPTISKPVRMEPESWWQIEPDMSAYEGLCKNAQLDLLRQRLQNLAV